MSLRGKRVLVTRALHQAAPLTAMLRERGVIPLSYPCLEVAPLDNCDELDAALGAAAAGNFDWLLLSSSNSARALAARMAQLDLELPGSRVALMGAASAAAARSLAGARLCAQVRAGDYAALPDALKLRPGMSVLLPQSDVAPPTLREALRRSGAQVSSVAAWRNLPGSGGVDLAELLQAREVDGLLFTSASILRNAEARLRSEGGDPALLHALPCACLGSPTAAAAQAGGFQRVQVARDHSLAALLDALARHWHTAASSEQKGLPS